MSTAALNLRRRPTSRRRLPGAMPVPVGLAAAVLAGLIVVAALAPLLRPGDVEATDLTRVLGAPSAALPFGTDIAGRDLLAQVLLALRVSFTISISAALVSVGIGVLLGLVVGTCGRWVDSAVMRLVDFFSSQSHFLFAILLVVLFRPVLGPAGAVMLSVGLTHWTSVARIVRGELLSLRERPYILAAVSAGASRGYLARAHYLPNLVPSIGTALVLLLPHAIFHESALSFLGLGLPPHRPSLGNLLADSQGALLAGAWWTSLFPGLAIFLLAVSVGTVGEWLRDRSQPRWRAELEL